MAGDCATTDQEFFPLTRERLFSSTSEGAPLDLPLNKPIDLLLHRPPFPEVHRHHCKYVRVAHPVEILLCDTAAGSRQEAGG